MQLFWDPEGWSGRLLLLYLHASHVRADEPLPPPPSGPDLEVVTALTHFKAPIATKI